MQLFILLLGTLLMKVKRCDPVHLTTSATEFYILHNIYHRCQHKPVSPFSAEPFRWLADLTYLTGSLPLVTRIPASERLVDGRG